MKPANASDPAHRAVLEMGRLDGALLPCHSDYRTLYLEDRPLLMWPVSEEVRASFSLSLCRLTARPPPACFQRCLRRSVLVAALQMFETMRPDSLGSLLLLRAKFTDEKVSLPCLGRFRR